jgi:hypothetical protein
VLLQCLPCLGIEHHGIDRAHQLTPTHRNLIEDSSDAGGRAIGPHLKGQYHQSNDERESAQPDHCHEETSPERELHCGKFTGRSV